MSDVCKTLHCDVAVIGGGDTAAGDAAFLSAMCKKVLMVRSSMSSSSGQRRVISVTVRVSPSTVKCTSSPANSMPYTRAGSCW